MQNHSQFNQHHVLKQRDMQETGKDSIWFDCFFFFLTRHVSLTPSAGLQNMMEWQTLI